MNLNDKKLEIEYPCSWNYKVIILQEHDIEGITKTIFGQREHKIIPSKNSKNGKYQSFQVTTLVYNDDDRTEIFFQIKKEPNVKMVL